jgi:hypothetical protein
MKRPLCLGLAGVLALALPASGQTTGKRTGEQIEASFQAHKDEFDYLLGDWEFTAESKQFGRSRATGAR